MPAFLTPEGRKRAARKRQLTRGMRAFLAIVLALFAGIYLTGCHLFQRTTKQTDDDPEQKTKVDRKEHRRGMPVRDNIVE